ncbi:MAG: dynamin family protein [Desulfatiglandaceae bacterium]
MNLTGFFLPEAAILDHYKEIRIQLIGNIEHLRGISSGRGNAKIADNLTEISEKLIENRFHLVVPGQFKRGKSTFINSIIGDRILPTSVVPLTSIVTMVKYGQQEQTEVIFEEGNRQVIEDALGRDGIEIHPLSAKLALEAKKSGNGTLLAQSRLSSRRYCGEGSVS